MQITAIITPEVIQKAMSWQTYWNLNETLVAEKRTTGPIQNEELSDYTILNWSRMQRIEKTLELQADILEKLANLKHEYIFLAIAEAWCGDAAQSLPAIAKVASKSDKLEMKVLLRDEHPEVMDNYLTNGSKSIPIVVVLRKDTLEEVAVWGPRPKAAAQILADYKANPEMSKDEFHKNLHTWYARNKSVDVQNEIVALLS